MLNLDPAAVSLMLRAKRKMTADEAHQVAQILGVPTTEVLRQAGIEINDDVRRVPIKAYMDDAGNVSYLSNGTHEHIVGPADCPVATWGVQLRSPNSIKDGWLLFVSPDHISPAENIDHLCVCADTTGKERIGVLRRGYRTNTYNLVLWPTMQLMADQSFAWASRVLWIRPA